MKTQISLLVKNESISSRTKGSLLWFINVFKKLPVEAYLDTMDNKMTFIPRQEPYLIDVTPGHHEMLFNDPRKKKKARDNAIVGAVLGATLNAAGGGSFLGGAADGYKGFNWNAGTETDDIIQFDLQEGDVIKLSAQIKTNGRVKIKVLKK